MYEDGYGYRRPQYGPLNALADILGAYWGKKSIEGALNDAGNMGQRIDEATEPKYIQNPVQPEQTGSAIVKKYAQELLPTQSPVQGVKPNFGIDGSLFDTAVKNSIFQRPQSIMQEAQVQADKSNQQQQYNDFATAKAANPEWYIGDTYVGNDQQAKAMAQQQQQEAARQGRNELLQGNNSSSGKFSSGMEQYGFTGKKTQPLSYDAYLAKTKQLKATTMRDMVRKYGIDSAKQVESMIDSAISDKNAAYGAQIDATNRKALGQYLLSNDIDTMEGRRKAMWAAIQYNNDAQKMGRATIDTGMLDKILSAGNLNIKAQDEGGSVVYYAEPKEAARFNNGSVIIPILSANKTLSPSEEMNGKLNQQKFDEQVRHNQATEANTRRGQDMSAARAASSRGSGGAKDHSAAYLKIADTLQYKQEAAISAIKSGDAADDPDDHSVEEYRKACADALQSGQLDGDDKAAVRQQMNDVMDLYQNSL